MCPRIKKRLLLDQTSCLHNASKLELPALIGYHNVRRGCEEIGKIIIEGYEIFDMAGIKINKLQEYKKNT
jgi:hypothetical protein